MKYITRKKVIQAIRTEKLESGSFVEGGYNENTSRVQALKNQNCKVCAVGAVLRNAGLSNRQIDTFGDNMMGFGPVTASDINWAPTESVLQEYLKDGKYLRALSVKFEDQSTRTGTGKRTRKVLINFVKKNFPYRIAISPRK